MRWHSSAATTAIIITTMVGRRPARMADLARMAGCTRIRGRDMAILRPRRQPGRVELKRLEPAEGFEPPTSGLQNRCATTTLCRRE